MFSVYNYLTPQYRLPVYEWSNEHFVAGKISYYQSVSNENIHTELTKKIHHKIYFHAKKHKFIRALKFVNNLNLKKGWS